MIELGGQLALIKCKAAAGLNGTKRGAAHAADTATMLCIQGPMLLGLLSVGGEGIWESMRGRSWVDLWSVVDFCTLQELNREMR